MGKIKVLLMGVAISLLFVGCGYSNNPGEVVTSSARQTTQQQQQAVAGNQLLCSDQTKAQFSNDPVKSVGLWAACGISGLYQTAFYLKSVEIIAGSRESGYATVRVTATHTPDRGCQGTECYVDFEVYGDSAGVWQKKLTLGIPSFSPTEKASAVATAAQVSLSQDQFSQFQVLVKDLNPSLDSYGYLDLPMTITPDNDYPSNIYVLVYVQYPDGFPQKFLQLKFMQASRPGAIRFLPFDHATDHASSNYAGSKLRVVSKQLVAIDGGGSGCYSEPSPPGCNNVFGPVQSVP